MNPIKSLSEPPGSRLTSTPALAASVSMPVLRLVKAKEFEVQLSVQAIRKRAETNADQLIKDTLARAAAIEAAARLKGEQKGLQQYAESLAALETARSNFTRDAEHQLVSSVFAIVKQLLPTLPEHMITEDIVLQLIRCDAKSRAIKLFVPQAQLEYATSRMDAWRLEAAESRPAFSIEVKFDGSLAPDMCVLKSEFGTVTANLAEQLNAMEASARAALLSSANCTPELMPAPKRRSTRRPEAAETKIAQCRDGNDSLLGAESRV